MARVNRAAIDVSAIRKAAAIAAVGTPQASRRVSATWSVTRDPRIAAEHHQPQVLVPDDADIRPDVGGVHGMSQTACGPDDRPPGSLRGTDPVDRPSPGRGDQPGLDRRRHAALRPGLQGKQEGVGGRFLGDVQIPHRSQGDGQHPTGQLPLGPGRHLRDGERNHVPACGFIGAECHGSRQPPNSQIGRSSM